MKEDRDEQLLQIKGEILRLTASPLYQERVQNKVFPVIGEGNHDAAIMFIGEAPGRTEAATGRPFCGKAGKVLDELLSHIALERQSVYITNIVKDRPPENRDPLPEEIALYGPFLDRQIAVIQPKVIATLGRFSMKYILEAFHRSEWMEGISALHGRVIKAEAPYGSIFLVPLFHPAVAIYTASRKDELKKDMEVLRTLI